MSTTTTTVPSPSIIPAPHHRKNRRRERPGSRARRSLSRKESLQSELSEGLLEARDTTLRLPSDNHHHSHGIPMAMINRSRPSPVLRQNWEQSAARWRAREMEEKIAEMVREQRRMFGGEEDSGSGEDIDGTLRRMNILHEETYLNSSVNVDLKSTPLLNSFTSSNPPQYTIRPPKLRRTQNARKKSTWQDMELQLALYLSLSSLADDQEIARFMDDTSTPTPLTTTNITTTAIKRTREETFLNSTTDADLDADIIPLDADLKPVDDIVLSLPTPTSSTEPAPPAHTYHALRDSHPLSTSTDSLSSSLSSADEWTFLHTNSNTNTDIDTHPPKLTRIHTQHQTDAGLTNHAKTSTHTDNELQPQTPLSPPLSPFSETETWILVE